MQQSNGEMCKLAQQRYRDARRQLNVYTAFLMLLTLSCLMFAIWVVISLMRRIPVPEQSVQLVGLVVSGAIGAFILARRKDALAEEEQARQDVEKYCPQGTADQLRAELKYKLIR